MNPTRTRSRTRTSSRVTRSNSPQKGINSSAIKHNDASKKNLQKLRSAKKKEHSCWPKGKTAQIAEHIDSLPLETYPDSLSFVPVVLVPPLPDGIKFELLSRKLKLNLLFTLIARNRLTMKLLTTPQHEKKKSKLLQEQMEISNAIISLAKRTSSSISSPLSQKINTTDARSKETHITSIGTSTNLDDQQLPNVVTQPSQDSDLLEQENNCDDQSQEIDYGSRTSKRRHGDMESDDSNQMTFKKRRGDIDSSSYSNKKISKKRRRITIVESDSESEGETRLSSQPTHGNKRTRSSAKGANTPKENGTDSHKKQRGASVSSGDDGAIMIVNEPKRNRPSKPNTSSLVPLLASTHVILSSEENALVKDALFNQVRDDNIVLAKIDTATTINQKQMKALKPCTWLNDAIVSYFLKAFNHRDLHLSTICGQDRKRSHCFSTFFDDLFSGGGYTKVQNWARKRVPNGDIFKLDKFIFICHTAAPAAHWTCAVAKMQERRIEYYDSLSNDGSQFTSKIMKYIRAEWAHRNNGEKLPKSDSWQIENVKNGVPQQDNGYDCGIFTIMYANYILIDKKMEFNQSDIDKLRPLLALAIMRKWKINEHGDFERTFLDDNYSSIDEDNESTGTVICPDCCRIECDNDCCA